MATDNRKVQLGIGVDASEAKAGFAEVKKAGIDLADGIQQAGKRAGQGMDELADRANKATTEVTRSERTLIGSIERATAALKAGGKAGSDYYEILARDRGISGDAIAPYIAKLREAEAAQKALSAATQGAVKVQRATTDNLNESGMSAKALSAALRGVPAQFTDIFVSLQGGQAPLTVLLQQGGQLKDMFGGAIPAAQALGGYVMGLVNPFTLAAAAAAGLSYAYYVHAQQSKEFAKSIALSGNAAGVTADQLASMAKRMGGSGGAASALAELAESGQVAGDSLERYAKLGLTIERDVGIPVKQMNKDFAELGRAPLEASLKLTEQYRYLTVEVYNQIKALVDQGNTIDAARVAQNAYAQAWEGNVTKITQNLGVIERGWKTVTSAAKSAWNAMMNVGRSDTIEETLGKMQERLATMDAEAWKEGPNYERHRKVLTDRIAGLRETLRLGERAAQEEAALVQRREAGVKWLQEGEKFLSKQAKLSEEIERTRALGKAAGQSSEEIEKRVADVKANSKNKATPVAGMDEAARRNALGAIQSSMREELAMVDAHTRELERVRQAGGLSDADYYAQRKTLIEQSNTVEEGAYRKQIKRLEGESVKGKDALNVQREIAELKSKLVAREIEGQTKLDAVNQQAEVAAKKREATLRSLTETHERYVESLQLRADREVAAVGMGDRQRQFTSGRDAIGDKFLQQQRALEDQRMFAMAGNQWNPDDEAAYSKRLSLLQDEKRAELAIYDDTYSRINDAQSRWELGMSSALSNYMEQARNVAGQTATLFTSAFGKMEDALTQFVMTGKLDFKSLASSIIADMVRVQARAAASNLFSMAASALSSYFGGTATTGTSSSSYSLTTASNYSGGGLGLKMNAKGGVYDSPSLSSYRNQVHDTPKVFAFAKGAGVFGEAGAEAIMPLTRSPDGNLGVRAVSGGGDGAAPITITVHVDASGSKVAGDDSESRQLGAKFGGVVRGVLIEEMRPGGLLA